MGHSRVRGFVYELYHLTQIFQLFCHNFPHVLCTNPHFNKFILRQLSWFVNHDCCGVSVCTLSSYELHSLNFKVSSGLHSSWDIAELGALCMNCIILLKYTSCFAPNFPHPPYTNRHYYKFILNILV